MTERRHLEQAIAARAATMILPGTAIALSTGRATWAMARHLTTIAGLVVVTNSTAVADAIIELDVVSAVSVILTGGVRTPGAALVGPVADNTIASLRFDRLFLDVHGMDGSAGFTTPSLAEAWTNRAFVQSAREVVVLAESSKWGVVGLADIGPLELATILVTDTNLPVDARRVLARTVGSLVVVE